MQARSALIAAIICGTLAVSVVAADVVWSLEASFEAPVAGEWQTIATTHPDDRYWRDSPFPFSDCYGPVLRLVVDNNRPISADIDVHITYHNATSKRTETLLRDTLSLPRFADHTYEFTIPEAAFPTSGGNNTDPFRETLQVQARVGPHQLWASTCLEVDA